VQWALTEGPGTQLGRGGAQHVTSADDLPTLLAPGPGGGPAVGPAGGLAFGSAGGPLCRAPQTVEGTTFIYARPGRSNELATLLESHPMSVRGGACPDLTLTQEPLQPVRTAVVMARGPG